MRKAPSHNKSAHRRALPRVAQSANSANEDKKAEVNLLEMQKAVDAASTVSGGFWLSYIFVLLYLAVAAGAVTHVDLLLENPVKLPFLNIELPLFWFFFLAPWLFVLTHAHVLAHFALLGDKARAFNTALEKTYPDEQDKDRTAREEARQRLPIGIFVQALAGPTIVRRSLFGKFLRFIAWASLVVAPLLLLLEIQIQYLAYHSHAATWSARIAIVVDLILIWALWARLVWPVRPTLKQRLVDFFVRPLKFFGYVAALFASFCVLAFSLVIATFQGEKHDKKYFTYKITDGDEFDPADTIHTFLFDRNFNFWGLRRKSLFSNTLVLPNFDWREAKKIDDPEKYQWHEWTMTLRERDLRGADFVLANLGKADLSGANLEGAHVLGAHLEGASLRGAQLHGADLVDAHLEGASLHSAYLEGAQVFDAHLEGASLHSAYLEGAQVFDAHLDGADLKYAHLEGANLTGAHLEGARLHGAHLEGANLESAHLEGADLTSAHLEGANLQRATLKANDLRGASLWRVSGEPRDISLLWFDQLDIMPGNNFTYDELRKRLETSIPAGQRRDKALQRIAPLDCAQKNDDFSLCGDTSSQNTSELIEQFERAKAEDEDEIYREHVRVISDLICDSDGRVEFIYKGVEKNSGYWFERDELKNYKVQFAQNIKACAVFKRLDAEDQIKIDEMIAKAQPETATKP